jgi:NitT/TauT family transport system ATP-binding protein
MRRQVHITVRGLKHVYDGDGQPLVALDGVDLEVGRGEFVSVIGPSGGGKTTLLKVIGGLLEPSAGSVTIDGLTPAHAQRAKEIGFVFQDPALLPWRTVFQNVRLPLELKRARGRSTAEEPERLVDAVGLREFRDYYPHQLSGGMRQRVAFARALATEPVVLLMDEPLGALDEITRTAMRYELLRVWEGSRKTVVLVTHSVPEAVMMSDRVVVLSARPGRVMGQVSVEIPRPREESLERSPGFMEYADRVREIMSVGTANGAPALATRFGA